MFLEISQNSHTNTCASVYFLNKIAGLDSGTGLLMWILRNFLRTPFFKEHLRWLLLNREKSFRSFWFVSLSFSSKLQKQLPKGVIQKYVLKVFSKNAGKYLRRSFLIGAQASYVIKRVFIWNGALQERLDFCCLRVFC